MSTAHVVRYQEEKGIGWITLNRSEALNALNVDILQRLASILDTVRIDDRVAAVIVTGAGDKAFSAGADITLLNQ